LAEELVFEKLGDSGENCWILLIACLLLPSCLFCYTSGCTCYWYTWLILAESS